MRYYRGVFSEMRRALGDSRPIDVTKEDVEAWLEAKQKAGVTATTVNMYLRGWRAFFTFLYEGGFIRENPAARVKFVLGEKRIIETFSRAQLKALLDVPDRATFTGYRDYVAMLIMLDTGVRVSELVGIRMSDINYAERTIKIRGKGRKERLVPFQTTLERHLRTYEEIRGYLETDALIVTIDNTPMRPRSMQDNIAKIGLASGITGVRVSPHTFRHTFAKMYVMNGGDMASLQRILGHATLDMVRTYVNLFSTDVSRQHAKYSPLERLHVETDDY